MRNLLTNIIMMLGLVMSAQGLDGYQGRWNGSVMGLPLEFDIQRADTAWTVTMSSPKQGAFNIPCQNVSVGKLGISFAIPSINMSYSGLLKDDVIHGVFTQGQSIPLKLRRQQPVASQEMAVADVPYAVSEVTFPSPCGVLAGTLTLPETPIAAIVTVTGSGPQNRDEEIMGHKPFAVLADSLSRNGVAVLRYDDRGVGGSTAGKPTDTTVELAQDAMAAIDYLKTLPETANLKIGILGHSEGGTIAFIAAAERSEDVAFVISLAGGAVSGHEILVTQNHAIAEASGHPLDQATSQVVDEIFEVLRTTPDSQVADKLGKVLDKMPGMTADERERQIAAMTSPWYLAFVRLDPTKYLENVKCPVLAMNGDKDVQVDGKTNLAAIKQSIPSAETVLLADMNHLFQNMKVFPLVTSLLDYSQPVPTPDPVATKHVVDWVKKL